MPLSTGSAVALSGCAQHLAREIHAGAQLWVVAPGLDDHARHLAVEFVHPASVGARAVAATAVLPGPDRCVIGQLRRHSRSGDVVMSLGDADADWAADLSMRTQAWGTSHVHLGWSAQTAEPPLHPRTVLVRVGDGGPAERLLTRTYHLLWELTSICLQRTPATVPIASQNSCAVCADDASIAEVEAMSGDATARVRSACGTAVVDVSCVGPVSAGDLLLIHAGTAIRLLPVGQPA